MSFTIGAQIECDRCGKTAFLRYTRDGGEWTRSDNPDNYESAEGWVMDCRPAPVMKTVDLCPACFHSYKSTLDKFWRSDCAGGEVSHETEETQL